MKEEGYQEFWTSGKYWTSTESTNYASNNAPLAWKVYLSTSDEDYIDSGLEVLKDHKSYGATSRPFTAF